MNCMFKNCLVLHDLKTSGWQINSFTTCTDMMANCPADLFINQVAPYTVR